MCALSGVCAGCAWAQITDLKKEVEQLREVLVERYTQVATSLEGETPPPPNPSSSTLSAPSPRLNARRRTRALA